MFHSFDPFEGFGRGRHAARGGGRRGGGFGGPGGPPGFGGGPGGPGGFGDFGGPGGPFRGGPMPWMRWFGQRPTRARRGDIRAAILALLSEKALNGYQIMQELEARSEGRWRPSPGSVYPSLQQLEDEELVEVQSSAQGKVYELTTKGKTYVTKHPDEVKAPWTQGAGEAGGDRVELFQTMRQLMPMLAHLAQSGTPQQLAEASKVLEAARKAIGRMLFVDDPRASTEGPGSDEGEDEP